MSDIEMDTQTEYLNRAKKLRDTATQVNDPRVMEALISSAESYERMATSFVEAGHNDSACTAPKSRNSLIVGFVLAVSAAAAMQLMAS